MTKKELANKLAEKMHSIRPAINIERTAKTLNKNMTQTEIEKALEYYEA